MKRITKLHLAVFFFNAIFLTNSILGGLKKNDITYYFGEGETVTFFSAFFLGATFFISLLIFYARRLESPKTSWLNFWLVSSFGFFYLMLDEFFMIHEGMDRAILGALGFEARAYNFDGFILAFFGLLGALFLFQSRKEWLAHKDFIRCLTFGFGALAVMVASDQMEAGRPLFQVFDDSFKMVGVSYFLAGYASALMDRLKGKASSLAQTP